MNILFEMMAGKKTYFVCLLTIIIAIVGLWKGWFSAEQALQLLSTAGIGASLRHGISNEVNG
jgi:hypothetical protein